ncbi:MAG: hypothetical protein LV480_07580 [Methylacidiphilales bacterium]|nr:hypothetical protein [Candidatus Methylacidiphilales bacterium]
MSRTRKLIIAFWVFIVCMLLWQFYTYNQGLTQAAIDHPQQEHFYFFHTNAPPAAPSTAHTSGADVEQVGFTTEQNVPAPGYFTCHVTLKNVGNAKAEAIQIMVRPFRGVSNYDQDVGQQHTIVLTDDDPISKFGDWLSFPDLAPGESSTQTISFMSRSDFQPGANPKPNILFHSEKPKP